jgi:hypothetical protein
VFPRDDYGDGSMIRRNSTRWHLMLATRNISDTSGDPYRIWVSPIQCKPGERIGLTSIGLRNLKAHSYQPDNANT